jgi:hypothetical protein
MTHVNAQQKSPRTRVFWGLMYGAAGRIRTHDPLVRSQVLYPTELQPLKLKLYTENIVLFQLNSVVFTT